MFGNYIDSITNKRGNRFAIFDSFKHWPTLSILCSKNAFPKASTNVSGGKLLSKKTKRTVNRVSFALEMSALALSNSKSDYRRMRSRHGSLKAIIATAQKLARFIYSVLKNGTEYVCQGWD